MTQTNTSPKKHTSKKVGRPPSATLIEAFPEVAAQLVDQSLAHTLSRGSEQSVEWRCHLDHRWWAKVYNRTNAKNKTACPICNGKKVLVGYNDLATTRPDIAMLCANPEDALTHTQYSNKKIPFQCATDQSHIWEAPVSRLSGGVGGCPYCSGRNAITGTTDLATTHPEIAAQLVDQSLATKLKAGSSRKVPWQCQQDKNHVWITTPSARTSKQTGCPHCSGRTIIPGVNDLATTHPEIAATLVDTHLATQLSQGSMDRVNWRCTVDSDHIWESTPNNRIKTTSCGICNNKRIIPGVNDIATTHPDIATQIIDQTITTQISAGSGRMIDWQCPVDPEHHWITAPYVRTGKGQSGCPDCFGPGPSSAETELADAIKVLVSPDEVLTSDQTVLPGRYELDIAVPTKNVAVEFNGVYWHSEVSGKPSKYHAEKSRMAHEAGYQLLHVWEDDWAMRPDIIIRAIAHKLHATHKLLDVLPDADPRIAERIYARKLTLDSATGTEAHAFLNAHHIQGAVTATRHFVLRQGTEIRAILSLRSPRNNARMKRGVGVWEIQRFATFGTIPGGFTRLMKYAEKTLRAEGVELNQWISFSSADISDGGLYELAGFTAEATIPPDYKYVGNATQWRRAPKERFQLKKFREDPDLLWDESWSEHEAALANNLYRVYDAGKTRWIKNLT